MSENRLIADFWAPSVRARREEYKTRLEEIDNSIKGTKPRDDWRFTLEAWRLLVVLERDTFESGVAMVERVAR